MIISNGYVFSSLQICRSIGKLFLFFCQFHVYYSRKNASLIWQGQYMTLYMRNAGWIPFAKVVEKVRDDGKRLKKNESIEK